VLLRAIRHAYIALHQDTEAAPTAFSASTDPHDDILYELQYCHIYSAPSPVTAQAQPTMVLTLFRAKLSSFQL
jgi:hypothetical protein